MSLDVTAVVLLHGDYPDLAAQLLDGFRRAAWAARVELRICCNAVSSKTAELVSQFQQECPLVTRRVESPANVMKYPMMRSVFHDEPLTSKFVMWFDDDSRILPGVTDSWLDQVVSAMGRAEMIGALYHSPTLPSDVVAFYRRQPWFTGKPFGRTIPFITGGWWTIHTRLIQQYDWPPPDMLHSGGDVALGMVALQQGWRLGKFTEGLAINADATGRCSSAARRGIQKQPYYGSRAWEQLKVHYGYQAR